MKKYYQISFYITYYTIVSFSRYLYLFIILSYCLSSYREEQSHKFNIFTPHIYLLMLLENNAAFSLCIVCLFDQINLAAFLVHYQISETLKKLFYISRGSSDLKRSGVWKSSIDYKFWLLIFIFVSSEVFYSMRFDIEI